MSAWWFRKFSSYAKRYLRRNFYAVRIARHGYPPPNLSGPVVVLMNHPAWWDPLTGLFLATQMWPERVHFAPIDQRALRRYRILGRIGFFGVEQSSRSGAKEFLTRGVALLHQPSAMLWITAQGEFADIRLRPVQLRPGIGHLLQKCPAATVLPLAVEYVFWEERYAELLVSFGPSFCAADRLETSAKQLTAHCADQLEATMDALQQIAIHRNPADFEILLQGRAGVGGFYDFWSKLRARWRGETFRPEHAAVHE
ncbi:MAG: acyltransferase [Planctomycetota bacterium]|nr:MAG: acyltransferase [Planctomycetota bacterium]